MDSTSLKSINPATGEVLGEVPVTTPAQVTTAIEAARAAQPAWRAVGVEGRAQILKRLHDDIEAHKEEFAKLTAQEMGSPYAANLASMNSRLNIMRWNLENAASILAPETVAEDDKYLHQVHFEPHGIFGIIVPWNVPFSNFVRTTFQPLLAGNTVVYKMSEEVPLFGQMLDGSFARAGVPQGVFTQIYGKGDVGEALVRGAVDHIHFTGSTAVGKKLYQIAAEKFIPITLELGGSDPGIICADADLDRLIPVIFKARFGNSGQICSALKRLFVHASRYEELVQKLNAYIARQKIGDPMQSDTVLGPLVSEKQKKLLTEQVEDAKAKGVKILFDDPKKIPSKGAYFEPVVMTDLTPDMRASHEELFGPVLTVETFLSEDDVIMRANDTEYGLSAYIYTEDRKIFNRIAAQLRAGSIIHNAAPGPIPALPFGGYKHSGLGRSGGKIGLRSCCQVKSVSMEKA